MAKTKDSIKLLKNLVFNFNKLRKNLNKHNLNKLIEHIKKGNYSFINDKIGFYTNTELKKMELELISEIDSYEPLLFKKVKNPKVSIIIPVYNQFEYTYKCLKSILKNTDDVEYEIIIGDDVSNDETVNIEDYIQNITIVRNEKNLGFLLNCNNAAKYATGEYLHFLNNDTQVTEKWLSSLVELIESDKKIGMVGSKLVYPDGRQQEAGGIIWNDASGWNFGRLDDPSKPEYNYVKEVDYISGASIMLSKKLWFEIGGFDERYVPAYYEDSDLAFEVRNHGLKVMLQTKSVVVHFEGISNGTDLGSGMKKYQVVNKEKFIKKWENELEKNHFSNAENVFLARDRSKDKKHILVIDHYIPLYDQDAGSKAMLNYIELFAKLEMSIKFIGDNFYHYPNKPYLSKLEQLGVEVLYGVNYAKNWKEWLVENGKYFDYVILSRPHIATKYIDEIKLFTSAKIIYFGVDLHYLREEREYDISKNKDILKSSQNWKNIECDLMKKSDLSCFYSHVEIDEINEQFFDINAIQIPLYIYTKFKDIIYEHKNRNDIMFVGGFAHSPNEDAVIWFVNNIWKIVKKRLPELKFYIIGSNPSENIKNLSTTEQDIIVTGYISDDELNNYYSKCRLAVVPLRFGAGIKGKVIEAMYEGIPLITTSVGVEGIVNVEECVCVNDDEKDFANSIIDIYLDESIGKKLSNNALKYCQKYFTIEEAKKCIIEQGIDKLI